MESVKDIAKSAINLKPLERIQLVETILLSLDEPNPEIEKLWIKEADARYEAYKKGKIKVKDWEKIKEKYK